MLSYKMMDITCVILTYNEEKHIARCIENVCLISKKIYVVDSISSDRTVEIASSYPNVEVIKHEWPGNQAAQFNWALDNLNITTDWILRMDADEYLGEQLIHEIRDVLPTLKDDICGLILTRDVIFMGKRIKYGKFKPVKLLRLWRTGMGVIENREMDEHTILKAGKCLHLKGVFYDANLNGVDAWIMKHLDYANREVKMIGSYYENDDIVSSRNHQKSIYYSFPLFWRCFFFFILRYIFLGGFLDGKQGFLWNFLQCWWYRIVVDMHLLEKSNNS